MEMKTAARCCVAAGRGVISWRQVRAIMRWLKNCDFGGRGPCNQGWGLGVLSLPCLPAN